MGWMLDMLLRLSIPVSVVKVSLATDVLRPAVTTAMLEEMLVSKNCHIALLSKLFACVGINFVMICAIISDAFLSLSSSRQLVAKLKSVSASLFVVSLTNNGDIWTKISAFSAEQVLARRSLHALASTVSFSKTLSMLSD